MEYNVILLAGGTGSRMQNSIPKQYLLLAGKPLIMHSLEKINAINEVSKVVIVCADEYRNTINKMIEQYGITKSVEYASAGETRQASVLSGLNHVVTDNVIIHEAARPFVTLEDYQELIDDSCENAIYGTSIPYTVIKGNEYVEGLLTRSELINVQLPQKFNTKVLLEAHLKAAKDNNIYTEDASLLYDYHPQIPIKVIKGRDYNIKITTRIDMLIGEILYEEIFVRRT